MKKNGRRAAERELQQVALQCPEGAAAELVRQIRAEHRAMTQPDRGVVRDVRDRGGVCFPGGMTAEEWRNRLPRALHGKRARCVPADELAQELADRGTIREPTSDAALDHLNAAYARARSSPPVPDPADLRRDARRVVTERVKRAVKELVQTAQREAQAACPSPPDQGKKRSERSRKA